MLVMAVVMLVMMMVMLVMALVMLVMMMVMLVMMMVMLVMIGGDRYLRQLSARKSRTNEGEIENNWIT